MNHPQAIKSTDLYFKESTEEHFLIQFKYFVTYVCKKSHFIENTNTFYNLAITFLKKHK